METIGTINFEWKGPRYVSSKSTGELQIDETSGFLAVVEEKIKDAPYFMWEVDVSELTGIEAATRRTIADWLQRMPDRAIAVVGAGFAQRTLAKLMLGAIDMLGRSGRNNQKGFFNESADAEVWIKEYAAAYEKKLAEQK